MIRRFYPASGLDTQMLIIIYHELLAGLLTTSESWINITEKDIENLE